MEQICKNCRCFYPAVKFKDGNYDVCFTNDHANSPKALKIIKERLGDFCLNNDRQYINLFRGYNPYFIEKIPPDCEFKMEREMLKNNEA